MQTQFHCGDLSSCIQCSRAAIDKNTRYRKLTIALVWHYRAIPCVPEKAGTNVCVNNSQNISCTFIWLWYIIATFFTKTLHIFQDHPKRKKLLQSAFGTLWPRSESVLSLVEELNPRSTLQVVPCRTTTQKTVICACLVSVDSYDLLLFRNTTQYQHPLEPGSYDIIIKPPLKKVVHVCLYAKYTAKMVIMHSKNIKHLSKWLKWIFSFMKQQTIWVKNTHCAEK